MHVHSRGDSLLPLPTIAGVFDDSPILTPSSGGEEGGTLLTIIGHGFTLYNNDINGTFVHINGMECVIINSTHSELICETPAASANTYDVDVSVEGIDHPSVGSFTYDSSITPTVTNMSPISGGIGDEIVFTGTGFSSTSEMNTVTLVAIDDSTHYMYN